MTATATRTYRLAGGTAGVMDITRDGFEERVEGEWFSCAVDRKAFKQLIKRSDGPALRFFGLWLGLLAASGIAAYLTWGTLWCIPFFAAYGVLYSMSDHTAHELTHGTPFKTRWLNEALLHLSGFMTLHEIYYWRWGHSRHHTDTIIVGRDPEIQVPRPPDIAGTVLDMFFLKSGLTQLWRIFLHALAIMNADGRHFIPEREQRKVFWLSRLYIAIYVGVIAWCIAIDSILPAMFIVLPRFYGGPLALLFNITQHAGLAEDVRDHRLNTRTFYANPVFRFLYMNMNYHTEHHMFPMVLFHALPALHALMKDQCAPAYPSLWACYREIVPALSRQWKDPTYFVLRPVPGLSVSA